MANNTSLLTLAKASWCAKANAFFNKKENDGLSGYNPFLPPPLPPWIDSNAVLENYNVVNEANTWFNNKHQWWSTSAYDCFYFCVICVFCNVFHQHVWFMYYSVSERKYKKTKNLDAACPHFQQINGSLKLIIGLCPWNALFTEKDKSLIYDYFMLLLQYLREMISGTVVSDRLDSDRSIEVCLIQVWLKRSWDVINSITSSLGSYQKEKVA